MVVRALGEEGRLRMKARKGIIVPTAAYILNLVLEAQRHSSFILVLLTGWRHACWYKS